MPELRFTVNGQPARLEVAAHEPLARVLRYRLGLTGTKVACDEAECGACTVLLDGQPVDSCIFPAIKAQGAQIQTIEGLARDGGLHPLQQAFIEQGAVQCGFCIPGFIMTAKALLDREPEPSQARIRSALKDTYCRCGCYVEIVQAVQAAGRALSGRGNGAASLPASPKALTLVGRPLPRPDALAKVTGQALYSDDHAFPGMLHGATLRAAHPHARIRRLDVTRARALRGVAAVLTHRDIPGDRSHGLVFNDWPVLCWDKVRYLGDALALVAADSAETARRALELVEVEYEPLAVVTGPREALRPDAPRVHEEGNLVKHIKVRKGHVEEGFARADVIIEHEYTTPIYEHVFMEPECSIGRVAEDGRIEVITGSQIPYEDRRQIAKTLGVPEGQVRVREAFIGGAFGGKEDIAGQIHAALLARATGRPAKVLYSRQESLRYHPKRHAAIIRLRTGARRDGRLVAVEAEIWGDGGAYASLSDKVMTRAATHAAGPYEVPHVKIDCYTAYTNNPPAGAFRGFGVTQSCFAVESQMDLLARELGLDPLELRRRNALRRGSVTSTGQVMRESTGLLECLERVAGRLPPDAFRPRRQGQRVRAWGIAAAYKNTGLGGGAADRGGAEVEVLADGRAVVRSAATDIGQGLPGVLAVVAAEELGLPYERVEVALPDTDTTPDGGPCTASRLTTIAGEATRRAAAQVRQQLAWAACDPLDASSEELVFRDGRIHGEGRSIALEEAVRRLAKSGQRPAASVTFEAPRTRPLGEGGDMHFGFSFAVQAVEVEVDLLTGEVTVPRALAATDVGRVINMLGVLGQIRGGLIMGLGAALTEDFPMEEGVPFVDTLARYKMPGIRHTPEITIDLVEDELSSGPYGAKGVGEIASIPTPAAIINALHNAVGVRLHGLPVDQDRLLRRLKPPGS